MELQKKIANLVREKCDAVAEIQDYIHLLQEANLQKNWVRQMLKIVIRIL